MLLEKMPAAIVNICVDPRLNHELVRIQVRSRLEEMLTSAQRIYVTSDVGGNAGSAFRNTLDLVQRSRDQLVLAAVLHHDDCLAAAAGLRAPLETTLQQVRAALGTAGIACPLLSGSIRTETSAVVWSDARAKPAEVINFRMPRMYG
jgi:hypothetical protein